MMLYKDVLIAADLVNNKELVETRRKTMSKRRFIVLMISLSVVLTMNMTAFATESMAEENLLHKNAKSSKNEIIEDHSNDAKKAVAHYSSDDIATLILTVTEGDSQELIDVKQKKREFKADTESSSINLPKNPEVGVRMVTESSKLIEIAFPEEVVKNTDCECINDTVVYNREESSVVAAVQAISSPQDGLEYSGIRQFVVIKDNNAPKEYSFDFRLPEGGRLVMSEHFKDGYTEDRGCAYVLDGDGNIQYIIESPWATDSEGNNIQTRYRVDGKTLIQTVDFNEKSAFPIVADPACYEYWKIEDTQNAGTHYGEWVEAVRKQYKGKGASSITANISTTVQNSVSGSIQLSVKKILESVGISASISKSWTVSSSDTETLTGRKKGVYALYYRKMYTKYYVIQRKYIRSDGQNIKGNTTKVATVLKCKRAVNWSDLKKIG